MLTAGATARVPPLTAAEVEGSVPARFARVAAACPDAVAVATASRSLTYAALDRRSDALAVAMAARAPGAAPVVAIAADPVATIEAMLATWKLGRIAVPVDPGYPPARVAAILDDCGAGLLVGDAPGLAVAATSVAGVPGLCIDDVDPDDPATPPPARVAPDDAYAIVYTSGSTGAPKGVVQTHRNRLHRVRGIVRSLAVGPGDRLSALHTPTFAAGMRDVAVALLTGAALLPFDLRRDGIAALPDWIDRERVTVVCVVVSTFRQLLAVLPPGRRLASVRAVRLGSEAAYRQDVEGFRAHFPEDAVLLTGYGASEAAGLAEYRIGPGTPLPAGRVPAGFAVEGVEILVQDDAGRRLSPGEAGAVVIRSPYLAAGYWRRPDLTAATFPPDPDHPGHRLYQTGDVGRLGADGCLELLGRQDHQVKIRGYRVHPGEIEAALREHPALREAVVTTRPGRDGELRLVAHVVPGPGAAPDASALRRFLHARLPAHLVPAAFVALDALPALPNGKVDRAALPAPPEPEATAHVRPRNPLEHQIAELWETLLGVGPVGATDDFFALGGTSLVAASFAAAMEAACGRPVSPAALLEAPTVAALAARLAREEAARGRRLVPVREAGARAPLFFLHGDYNGGGLYCHGLARALDPERPFLAVHPHGLDGGAVPATIGTMAAESLAAVRARQPHGPYLLGGHCHGGLIALEMARQLRAAGERVDLVVMVETSAPRLGLRALRHATDAWGRARGLAPDARAALFAAAEHSVERAAARLGYLAHRARGLAGPGGAARAAALLRRAWGGGRAAAGARPAGAPGPRAVHHRASRRHPPSGYPGRVLVIQAAEGRDGRRAMGWWRLLPRVSGAVVPGGHLTCLTRHVSALGARIERALAAAERDGGRDG